MRNLTIFLFAAIAISVLLFVMKDNDMPQHQLTVYGQDEYGPIDGSVGGKCSESKCLTVYVAPWCPYCTKARPMIVKLTEELRAEGVEVAIIVGSDELPALEQYAEKYPFPVLLDIDEGFYEKKRLGVPFFISSNNEGKIIQSVVGASKTVEKMRQRLDL